MWNVRGPLILSPFTYIHLLTPYTDKTDDLIFLRSRKILFRGHF